MILFGSHPGKKILRELTQNEEDFHDRGHADHRKYTSTCQYVDRREFIGGSDARTIMGNRYGRSWSASGGKSAVRSSPKSLSGNLIVQLGVVTEFARIGSGTSAIPAKSLPGSSAGCSIRSCAGWPPPSTAWSKPPGRCSRPNSCCRGRSREKASAENYMAQLQHNMWVTNAKLSVLSIITGGGKWVEISISADPLYQHLLFTAEKKFWRCVESGEPPRLFGVEPPRPRIEAVRIVDMSASNSWAEFAGVFRSTRAAFLEHEKAKTELKGLMPEDAKEAIGHGVRAKRSKSGAISFDLLEVEADHAAVQ